MKTNLTSAAVRIVCVCTFSIILGSAGIAQDWSEYGATKGGITYSAAAQIDRANVDELEVAWTYRTGEAERRGERFSLGTFQNTPTLVDGLLIVCTPFERIIALDPVSGEERWFFEAGTDVEGMQTPRYKCRGVATWTDTTTSPQAICHTRILLATTGFHLIAIDVQTGKRCPGFGVDGEVTVAYDKEQRFPGEVGFNAPPAVINGIVVIGSYVFDGVRADGPSGMVRAFDARTGESVWTFDPVPRDPEDPMYATWGGAAETIGAANIWTVMAADEERDLVFLPTSSPSNDYYGGGRPGDNRYANSVVALRGATGELVWHFQLSHHDVWDYDIPAQPILIDLERNGQTVPALLQITKQGFVFVFNRETGEPLFPIEERPVPQEGVEGEWLSPTQPFPQSPPPFMKQGITVEDAWGFTFLDQRACRKKIAAYRQGPIYTPPSLEGTVLKPGFTGGGNWGGGAYDPVSGILVVNSTRVPGAIRLIPASKTEDRAGGPALAEGGFVFPQSGARYQAETVFILSPLGAPCTAPPWGGLTAIDMRSSTIKWDVALGSIHRMLPVPLPFQWNLGTPVAGGPIITAGGLVFVASTMDRLFRAFDLETGAELWQAELPANGNATPMTYEADGRQFVVLAAGGHTLYGPELSDHLIAYALPK